MVDYSRRQYDFCTRKDVPKWWFEQAKKHGKYYDFRNYEVALNVDRYVAVHGEEPLPSARGTWVF